MEQRPGGPDATRRGVADAAGGAPRALGGRAAPELHGPVPPRPLPRLVRVPQWALRPERPEHRGAAAPSARRLRRERPRRPDRGEQGRLSMPGPDSQHGRLWTWLDERIGLADLERLPHQKKNTPPPPPGLHLLGRP